MKTKNLIVILGAVAFAAITININANNAPLSPRAAGNQITRVAGVNSEVNPASACAKTMRGTPKAVSECTSHTTMPSCNSTAVASAN
jgi:hypothetical protein